MNRKIRNTLLLFSCFAAHNQAVNAQQLTEKTALRFYEHHSSMKTEAPFGEGANGDQSAYDFVKHQFVNSFDMSTFRAYPLNSSVPASIDMVEHNGPFGNGGGFGVTSSNSTIWAQMGPPYIRGNDQTMFMLAPSSFNYETASQLSDIKNSFDATKASKSIMAVAEGSVYLAKIRNTEQYVAIKVTGVKDWSGGEGNDDVYFNFNYKYAATASGLDETNNTLQPAVFPNPAASALTIQLQKPANQITIRIFNTTGQLQNEYLFNNILQTTINIENLESGIYFVLIQETGKNTVSNIKFVKM